LLQNPYSSCGNYDDAKAVSLKRKKKSRLFPSNSTLLFPNLFMNSKKKENKPG
jgi:hypothetical protein